ncbi:MAG: hypothetical protein GX090_02300 [Firmicutes bacterium]|nr:hypothetical protein [Bacillota bacterium]HOB35682.1 hypothetical protein [Bacillota bacterium]HPZ91397.1 hypothetical protein [Bacillota bacterium]HQE01459.1 hypothetical protein [Bacillota bacterium]
MEERLKILEMVRDGKLSPQQAAELLAALEGRGGEAIVENFVAFHDPQSPARRLRIVTSSAKGTCTFDIPLGVIKFLNGIFPGYFKLKVNDRLLDREELMDAVYSGKKGVVYRERTAKGGEVVIKLI